MASKFSAAVLIVAILFCLLTTASAGLRPDRFAESLGLKIINAGGTNEIIAQYASFFFAVALVCAASLTGFLPRQIAFIILVAVFGGLFVGRLISLGLNGGTLGYSRTILALYVIDAVGLGLAVTAAVWK